MAANELTTTPKVHFNKKQPITKLKIWSHALLTTEAKDYSVEKTDFTILENDDEGFKYWKKTTGRFH